MIAGVVPIPTNGRSKPRIAKLGIVWIIPAICSVNSAAFLCPFKIKASGIAMTIAIRSAINEILI